MTFSTALLPPVLAWPPLPGLHALRRRLAAAALLLTATVAGQAADWQTLPVEVAGELRIDAESVVWVAGRARAWVWYEPARRSMLGWLLLGGGVSPVSGGKELAYVNCVARTYRIAEFDGMPRDARYLGRAAEVLPASPEAAVLNWLCHA